MEEEIYFLLPMMMMQITVIMCYTLALMRHDE